MNAATVQLIWSDRLLWNTIKAFSVTYIYQNQWPTFREEFKVFADEFQQRPNPFLGLKHFMYWTCRTWNQKMRLILLVSNELSRQKGCKSLYFQIPPVGSVQVKQTCATNEQQYEEFRDAAPAPQRLQPLQRDNPVIIVYRLRSAGRCIVNKLHSADCCLPPQQLVLAAARSAPHFSVHIQTKIR